MAFLYRIDDGIFRLDAEGNFGFEEAIGILEEGIGCARAAHAESGQRLPILMDIRKSTEQRSSDELRQIAEAIGEGQDALAPKCAIVVLAPHLYGLSRMFAVFAEWAGVEVRLFADPAPACEWLRE